MLAESSIMTCFLGLSNITPMSRLSVPLADALASGASGGNPVQVQVLSSALNSRTTLRQPMTHRPQ